MSYINRKIERCKSHPRPKCLVKPNQLSKKKYNESCTLIKKEYKKSLKQWKMSFSELFRR